MAGSTVGVDLCELGIQVVVDGAPEWCVVLAFVAAVDSVRGLPWLIWILTHEDKYSDGTGRERIGGAGGDNGGWVGMKILAGDLRSDLES